MFSYNSQNVDSAALLLGIKRDELETALKESQRPESALSRLPPPLLSKRQAAAQIGVSEPTVNRLLANKELRHVQIMGRVLFAPAEIERFVRQSKKSGIQNHKPGRPLKKKATNANHIIDTNVMSGLITRNSGKKVLDLTKAGAEINFEEWSTSIVTL